MGMISERIVPGSRLVIQNKDFPPDLIVLGIHDFDIVLGMDWLSKHRATLDCYKKEVRLVRPEEPCVIFRGIRREIAPIFFKNQQFIDVVTTGLLSNPRQQTIKHVVRPY